MLLFIAFICGLADEGDAAALFILLYWLFT